MQSRWKAVIPHSITNILEVLGHLYFKFIF